MIADSPLGPLTITANERGLIALSFAPANTPTRPAAHAPEALAADQLSQYWRGERYSFDLPIAARLTPLQREIARAMPPGTLTYAELAALVSRPGAARAVGRALATNPLPIIIACHRVLPASGGIGNYLGGTWRKRWLLEHEARFFPGRADLEP